MAVCLLLEQPYAENETGYKMHLQQGTLLQ